MYVLGSVLVSVDDTPTIVHDVVGLVLVYLTGGLGI